MMGRRQVVRGGFDRGSCAKRSHSPTASTHARRKHAPPEQVASPKIGHSSLAGGDSFGVEASLINLQRHHPQWSP